MLPQLSLIEKNIKVEPIDSTFKDDIMFYYDEIPFGTILSNPFLSIETMNENSM